MHDTVTYSRCLTRQMLSVNMDVCFQLQIGFSLTLSPTFVTDQEFLGIPRDSLNWNLIKMEVPICLKRIPKSRFSCEMNEEIDQVKADYRSRTKINVLKRGLKTVDISIMWIWISLCDVSLVYIVEMLSSG